MDNGAKPAAIFIPDAVQFDGGTRFTGTALWNLIRALHAQGSRFVRTVLDMDVHFACDTAWIKYINRGSVFDGKTTTAVSWLESAVLVHQKGGWLVRFLHSTRVPVARGARGAIGGGGGCFAPNPVAQAESAKARKRT